MKFRILSNLPDLTQHVSRQEILILLPLAASLSPAFRDSDDTEGLPATEGMREVEGRTVREGKHAAAG